MAHSAYMQVVEGNPTYCCYCNLFVATNVQMCLIHNLHFHPADLRTDSRRTWRPILLQSVLKVLFVKLTKVFVFVDNMDRDVLVK